MLFVSIAASIAFVYIWLPRVTKILVDLETREVHRQLEIMADGLLPFLLQNQFAATHETIDSVLERQTNWRQIVLKRPDGRQIYPIAAPAGVSGDDLIVATHQISMRGQDIAVLSAVVDITDAIALLQKEGRNLGYLSAGLLLLFMVMIASFLEALVARRTRALSRAASEMVLGNYQAVLPPETSDEVGQLTASFAQMRQKIFDNEQSLIQARIDAEEATIAKSRFLATMSHEIRTPMNGVIPIADLLLASELNERQERFVRTIQTSGKALLCIIDDILDLSRLEAGHTTMRQEPFDLTELAEGVCEMLGPKAFSKKVDLSCYVPRDMHGQYIGDPGRIRQILVNLVGNAIKFTERGSVILEVKQQSSTRGDPALRFSISDTGIGIADTDYEKVFDLFSQVDNSKSREFGGSGLGLAICKRLVEAMSGSIGVDSVAGQGSTFWFELVLKKHDAPDCSEHAKLKPESGMFSILIAANEQSKQSAEIAGKIFGDWGVQYRLVAGIESLSNLIDNSAMRPNLIYVDQNWRNPGTDDMIRLIKKTKSLGTVPMIMACAPGQSEATDQNLEIDAANKIIKPLRSRMLIGCARTLLPQPV